MTTELNIEQRKALHGSEYVAMYQKKPPTRIRNLFHKMSFDKDSDVVDFGCGDAVIIEYLKDRVRSYKGVDFSEEFIDIATERKNLLNADNVDFECNSISEFSKDHPGSFDVGFSFDLSEHVYDDEWQEIINSMFHCLRPGGVFYQHTPNARFILEIMKDKDIILKQFPAHIAVRNAEQNAMFLSRAGFQDIKVNFIPHYNIVRLVHPFSYLPLVGKFLQARLFITATKPIT